MINYSKIKLKNKVAYAEKICYIVQQCARSEVGLSRLPVTEEIAGSNPVGRANPDDLLFLVSRFLFSQRIYRGHVGLKSTLHCVKSSSN